MNNNSPQQDQRLRPLIIEISEVESESMSKITVDNRESEQKIIHKSPKPIASTLKNKNITIVKTNRKNDAL